MSTDLPITEADLQAYVDGRLAEGRRSELETWLASRPDEAERWRSNPTVFFMRRLILVLSS